MKKDNKLGMHEVNVKDYNRRIGIDPITGKFIPVYIEKGMDTRASFKERLSNVHEYLIDELKRQHMSFWISIAFIIVIFILSIIYK